jgi:hypothetical protein
MVVPSSLMTLTAKPTLYLSPGHWLPLPLSPSPPTSGTQQAAILHLLEWYPGLEKPKTMYAGLCPCPGVTIRHQWDRLEFRIIASLRVFLLIPPHPQSHLPLLPWDCRCIPAALRLRCNPVGISHPSLSTTCPPTADHSCHQVSALRWSLRIPQHWADTCARGDGLKSLPAVAWPLQLCRCLWLWDSGMTQIREGVRERHNIFSDHNAIKVKLDNKKTLKTNTWGKFKNSWNNNLWETAKTILRGKFIAINTYIQKLKINNILLHLQEMQNKEQSKFKVNRKKQQISEQTQMK